MVVRTFGVALITVASVTTWAAEPQPPRSSAAIPTHVLFLCPHGAAKSVLASAYFQQLAKERGLTVRVESAGTEPDAVVAPRVAEHLINNGYTVPVSTPRKVTSTDLAAADMVISLGCDVTALPQHSGELRRWDDVPALSEDFQRADEAVRQRVIELVEELVRRGK
jgi:arsenate reductase (thioredoxin)